MARSEPALRLLAAVLLAGPWQPDALAERVRTALRRQVKWAPMLAQRLADRFHTPSGRTRDRLCRALARWGMAHRLGPYDLERMARWLSRHRAAPQRPAFVEPGALPTWRSVGELADWLQLSPRDLEWFCAAPATAARAAQQQPHYLVRWMAKRSGGARLLESPRPRLKRLQRQLLRELLRHVPAHPAAHGFCAGRSPRTFAAPHVGQVFVLRIDLEDFFASVQFARVRGVFMHLGYSEAVAERLARLCTTSTADDRLDEAETRAGVALRPEQHARYRCLHLPQGAPTSPALANLSAWRLDARLHGLAAAAEARYTRYADDLAFSGGERLRRSAARFELAVAAIALEEGLSVNFRKTRRMPASRRQQLAGVVVNRRLAVRRDDYDRLKATLTNCLRHGPAGQNRQRHADFRQHLAGKVAWIESIDPVRGAKLRALLKKVVW